MSTYFFSLPLSSSDIIGYECLYCSAKPKGGICLRLKQEGIAFWFCIVFGIISAAVTE